MSMKKSTKAILAILAIILVLAITAGILGIVYYNKYKKGENFNFLNYKFRNFTYDIEGDFLPGNAEIETVCKQLYVDWAYGEVIIEGYEGENLMFKEDGRRPVENKLQWYRNDTTLYINYHKEGKYFLKNDDYKKTLHIYVPNAKTYKSFLIDVWTVSADITCKNLTKIGDIDVVTQSGKTTTENVTLSSCSFVSETGDFDLNITSAATEIETSTGNTVLTIPSDIGFNLFYETESGKLKSEFEITTNFGTSMYKDSSTWYSVKSPSGNLTINKQPVEEEAKGAEKK